MAAMDLGLRDRVYVVTGASRGLGLATARELVAEGARVVLSARHEQGVSDAVAGLGTDAVGVVADNADPDTPRRLVEVATQQWGRIDGALVSVGGPAAGRATEISDADWRAGFESVFLGAVRLARTVVASLGPGGSIVLVLSTSVRSPIPGLAVSNGLRPGLAMVAKDLADEVGPRGVRVNGLLPGRVATDRTVELDELTGDAEAARAERSATIPLRRYGEPEEFARVAAFVLSPAASYVTGTMLTVDGGALRAL
jgi:3-oxoacyl-[acyl-carrier protein] reductase